MEENETPIRSGNTKPGRRRNHHVGTGNPDEKGKSNFDSEHDEAEINPEKLEREKIYPDSSGDDNSKGHEPYEFKKNDQGKLVGQGGYGTPGYDGSSLGYKPKYKEIDINKLGKNLH